MITRKDVGSFVSQLTNKLWSKGQVSLTCTQMSCYGEINTTNDVNWIELQHKCMHGVCLHVYAWMHISLSVYNADVLQTRTLNWIQLLVYDTMGHLYMQVYSNPSPYTCVRL